MALLTFKGGVHPFEGKELSSSKAIEVLPPGDEAILFMGQHIGAPATPCVQVGDHVKKGQLIGEASGFVSANIHASIAGTVKAIDSRRHISGDFKQCVIIAKDDVCDEVEYLPKKLEELDAAEIIDRVKAGGVVGAGGATFPTHVKLAPKDPDKIDHILVNASECEPYITSDCRLMLERPEELIEGLKCILKIFPKAKGYLCIEENKKECAAKLSEYVKKESNIEIVMVKTKYPEGAERCLINVVAKRELSGKKLPADVGCIVDNVETVINIYRAVILGKPVITEVMTLSGDDIKEPSNFEVAIGTNLNTIIEKAGGFIQDPAKLISGGTMMGMSVFDTDVPTSKGFRSLLSFKEDEVSASKETACINCGRCVNACPIRLMPTKLAQYAESGNQEKFEEYYGTECIECGSCSYICPAKRQLATRIRAMKKAVIAANRRK